MKAYLLARVSTDDQKDALPAQTHRLLEYAKRRDYDFQLFELKESAYKGNRDEFKNVVDEIKNWNEKAIVVFDKIDRYTRDSSSEEVRILQSLYRGGKIELHFPSDNLFINQFSPATDLLRLGMGIVVAQYYSDAISDNVKRRFEQKWRDGEWAGMAPFGYRNTVLPNGKKWIEPDAFKADAIRDAFTQYASGVISVKELSKNWNESYGLSLSRSQLDALLQNPFYHGDMRVKGELYTHKYEPIISKDLFDQADSIRKGFNIKKYRWAGLPFVYRGLIKCAECGCRVTFERKKGLYIYGHCTLGKAKHKIAYVSEDLLTQQLMKAFKSIQIPPEAYKQVSEALRSSHEDKKRVRETTLMNLDVEIEKYQTRIEKVYEDYLDEKIPESLYDRKFEEYRHSQKSLQNKRVNLELVEDDYYGTVTHLFKLSKNAPELFQRANIEQKRMLVEMVLSNLRLKRKELLWEFNSPFNLMAEHQEFISWLRGKDSNLRPSGYTYSLLS